MTTRIAAVLKNDRGQLLPYTAQSTMSGCEEWCEANLANFTKVKELGGKVVQVEIRELDATAPATSSAQAAAQRVAKYLEERAKGRQLDPEEITSMNAGTEREARLLIDDLKMLTDFVKSMEGAL